MKTRREFLTVVTPLALGTWAFAAESQEISLPEPLSSLGLETLFLTWANNPLTSMRIQWLCSSLQKPQNSDLFYRKKNDLDWKKAKSDSHPFGAIDHWVNRVDLLDLIPGTYYQFKVREHPEIFKFKTAPENLTETFCFAEGGDIGTDPKSVVPLHQMASSWEPLFGLVVGDLSYSNGRDLGTELRYYKLWNTNMRGQENRLIPMVAGIGNHEVNGGYQKTRADAPFFYALFDGLFKGSGAYGTLDFGNYLSIILLDSHHTCEVEFQTEWLRATLAKRSTFHHRFVAYHVPAYPSVRKFDEPISVLIRKHWIPVIESAGVKLVFEHHDHAFKRSKKLLNGVENSLGVTYVGDGAWGRPPRGIRAKEESDGLLKRSSSLNVWKVTLLDQEVELFAGNEKREELDRFVV